jgi:hypothetical protein
MPSLHSLPNGTFGPRDISRITKAYECALQELRMTDRPGPLAEMIAMKIIAIAQKGERDPRAMSARAIKELGFPLMR